MATSTDVSPCNEDKDEPEVLHKPNKHHFERLKHENDEDQWIPGEELNTDGSSDEEGKKGVRSKHRREHKGARPKEKSLKNVDSLPKPALVIPEHIDSDNEEPIDISWKPKRGSIKLPHMTKDLDSSSSSASASATIAE